MRKALRAIVWLLVALVVPASAGLEAACRLIHAEPAMVSAQHPQDALPHHHDGSQDPASPQPQHPDHGIADVGCCHMMGVGSVGLPSDPMSVRRAERLTATAYWWTDHPIQGRTPPPALGPPRA